MEAPRFQDCLTVEGPLMKEDEPGVSVLYSLLLLAVIWKASIPVVSPYWAYLPYSLSEG